MNRESVLLKRLGVSALCTTGDCIPTLPTDYKERGEKLFYRHLSAMLPDLKKEHPWLTDVASVSVQQCLRHLDTAFKNFFAGRAKYPLQEKAEQPIGYLC